MTICLLSIKETAEFLKTKESTIRTWIHRKLIPDKVLFRIGSTVRFKQHELENWILNNECVQKS